MKTMVNLFRELAFVLRSIPRLARADLLIIPGSGQLQDYQTGPWGYPYTCFKWVLLARLMRIKVVFMSVGATPLSSRLSKMMFRCSLALASYRSFRDDTSRRLVEQIIARGENHVFPDLVYSFDFADPRPAARQSHRRTVGVNVIPFRNGKSWFQDNPADYDGYVRTMASFAQWLLERDYDVVFFPTQLRQDPPTIQDVWQVMESAGVGQLMCRVATPTIDGVEDLVEQIGRTDLVVAARFHGVLISYLLNKPVLGIAYEKKTEDLMKEVGQAEHTLSIHGCDLPALIRQFTLLESQAEGAKATIEAGVRKQRLALQRQYDQILDLLAGKDVSTNQGVSQ
jgi:polysaccharide pyruvyl transferase WcaK-like protein